MERLAAKAKDLKTQLKMEKDARRTDADREQAMRTDREALSTAEAKITVLERQLEETTAGLSTATEELGAARLQVCGVVMLYSTPVLDSGPCRVYQCRVCHSSDALPHPVVCTHCVLEE